jgi:hypothetical protein
MPADITDSRNLRNLHDTLKAAAEHKTAAHIGPKEAREGAEAIERVMEKTENTVAARE